jgi:hypothetical protein
VRHWGMGDLIKDDNDQTFEDTTPLHVAAYHGNSKIAELLICRGASIREMMRHTRTHEKFSAIDVAIRRDREKCFWVLANWIVTHSNNADSIDRRNWRTLTQQVGSVSQLQVLETSLVEEIRRHSDSTLVQRLTTRLSAPLKLMAQLSRDFHALATVDPVGQHEHVMLCSQCKSMRQRNPAEWESRLKRVSRWRESNPPLYSSWMRYCSCCGHIISVVDGTSVECR